MVAGNPVVVKVLTRELTIMLAIKLMVEFLGVRVGAVEVILLLGWEETIILVTQGMSYTQV